MIFKKRTPKETDPAQVVDVKAQAETVSSAVYRADAAIEEGRDAGRAMRDTHRHVREWGLGVDLPTYEQVATDRQQAAGSIKHTLMQLHQRAQYATMGAALREGLEALPAQIDAAQAKADSDGKAAAADLDRAQTELETAEAKHARLVQSMDALTARMGDATTDSDAAVQGAVEAVDAAAAEGDPAAVRAASEALSKAQQDASAQAIKTRADGIERDALARAIEVAAQQRDECQQQRDKAKHAVETAHARRLAAVADRATLTALHAWLAAASKGLAQGMWASAIERASFELLTVDLPGMSQVSGPALEADSKTVRMVKAFGAQPLTAGEMQTVTEWLASDDAMVAELKEGEAKRVAAWHEHQALSQPKQNRPPPAPRTGLISSVF